MTIFAKIIRREIPAHILYEDERALAFADIAPTAPVHFLVIPKEPIASVGAAGPEHEGLLGHLMLVAARVAREQGIAETGYRVVTNIGPDAGQSVFHLHLHVIGGRGLRWPAG